MTTWIIISWVFVALFTGLNIFIFLKLKKASQQMMQMAFPGAKDMNQAMAQMQQQLQGLKRGGFGKAGAMPNMPNMPNMNEQMRAAMSMLEQLQKKR